MKEDEKKRLSALLHATEYLFLVDHLRSDKEMLGACG